jgi:hypothetical protein
VKPPLVRRLQHAARLVVVGDGFFHDRVVGQAVRVVGAGAAVVADVLVRAAPDRVVRRFGERLRTRRLRLDDVALPTWRLNEIVSMALLAPSYVVSTCENTLSFAPTGASAPAREAPPNRVQLG